MTSILLQHLKSDTLTLTKQPEISHQSSTVCQHLLHTFKSLTRQSLVVVSKWSITKTINSSIHQSQIASFVFNNISGCLNKLLEEPQQEHTHLPPDQLPQTDEIEEEVIVTQQQKHLPLNSNSDLKQSAIEPFHTVESIPRHDPAPSKATHQYPPIDIEEVAFRDDGGWTDRGVEKRKMPENLVEFKTALTQNARATGIKNQGFDQNKQAIE